MPPGAQIGAKILPTKTDKQKQVFRGPADSTSGAEFRPIRNSLVPQTARTLSETSGKTTPSGWENPLEGAPTGQK